MASVARLVEAGIVPDLAIELVAQINAGVGNPNRLAELGMVPALAREIVAQIAGVANAGRLVELGMPGVPAREVAAQISGGGVIPINALLSRIDNQPLTSRIDGSVILARAA